MALTVFATLNFLASEGLAYTLQDLYHYNFVVNDEGFTWVTINFESSKNRGSSWVLVPKFSDWDSVVSSGQILGSELVESVYVFGEEYYFYELFIFSFQFLIIVRITEQHRIVSVVQNITNYLVDFRIKGAL